MTTKKRQSHYLAAVPRSIPVGKVLMHNHVRHTADMPTGVNGFRAWISDAPPKNFVRCRCGWSGLPHYRMRGSMDKCYPGRAEDLEAASDRALRKQLNAAAS
jgi:hypothetical protein